MLSALRGLRSKEGILNVACVGGFIPPAIVAPSGIALAALDPPDLIDGFLPSRGLAVATAQSKQSRPALVGRPS